MKNWDKVENINGKKEFLETKSNNHVLDNLDICRIKYPDQDNLKKFRY
jgi:hypothetical protein